MSKDASIPRLAVETDAEAIEALIPLSVRALHAPYYSPAQVDAELGPVTGLDRQLIRDGTYFVAERDGVIIGCGGWSRRRAVFGGDRDRVGESTLIDPRTDAARIRAFFVHPDWARRGIGTAILFASEKAARAAGFTRATMVATLAGEPFYARHGYTVDARYDVPLGGGLTFPVVSMSKSLHEP